MTSDDDHTTDRRYRFPAARHQEYWRKTLSMKYPDIIWVREGEIITKQGIEIKQIYIDEWKEEQHD